jgi:TolA-binding protein
VRKLILLIIIITGVSSVYAQTQNDAYTNALILYEKKQYSKAFEIFKELSVNNKIDDLKKINSKYYAAQSLLQLGELNGASSEFEEFIEAYLLSNFREVALYELGRLYFYKKEFRKAREKLQLLIKDYPKSRILGTANYWIGESFLAENKFIDAEEFLQLAIAQRNSNNLIDYTYYATAQLYELTNDFENAVSHYDELLSFYKNSSLAPLAQLRIGICYFNLKDYDNAILELTDPIIKNLDDEKRFESKYFLANSFLRLNDYKNASTIYSELLNESLPDDRKKMLNYGLAWIKFQIGNYQEAYEIFNRLSVASTDSIGINSLFWSAECKRYLGESKTANEIYIEFLEKYPSHPYSSRAQLGKGTVFFSQNQSEDAEAALLKAISSNDISTKGKSLTILGELKLNNNEFSQSKEYFLQAVRIKSSDNKLHNRAILGLGVSEFYLNNFNEAIKHFEDLLSRDRNFESDKTNFYLAESYFARKEFSAALKHYNSISSENEQLKKQTLYGKAYSFFNLKDFPNAVYYFNEYVTKYKTDSAANDAKLRLGDSYFGIKNFEKAATIYKELFKFDKELLNNDQAYYQYCQSLFKAGKSNEAVTEFLNLQQKFPRSQFADPSQYVIGWIYFQQNNFSEAISNYKRLILRYPRSALIPIAYYSIGDSYFNLAEYDSSIAYYNKILEWYPGTTYILDAVNGIQYAYVAKDQPENAISFIDQFVMANPNSKFSDQIYFKMGDIYYSAEQYANAIEAYTSFSLKYPSSQLIPNAHYWIGKSAANLKLETQAIESFEKVTDRFIKTDIGISAAIELSNIYSSKKLYPLVLNILNTAIDAQPTSNRVPELLFLRGQAEIQSSHLQDAYSTFDQIITYYDGSVFSTKAKVELATLEINRKNYDNALILLKELAEKRLDDIGAQAQFLIGEIHFAQSNIKEAITAYVRVRSIYSTFDEWYTKSLLKLGDCYVKLNDKKLARDMYRAVINRHRNSDIAKEATRKLNQL